MSYRDQKWTPGPWFVRQWEGDEWPEKRITVGPEDGRSSTAVMISPRYPPDHVIDDANLVAAAPDLVEALETLIEETTDVRGIDDRMEEIYCPEAYAEARAALAKAYGESEAGQ